MGGTSSSPTFCLVVLELRINQYLAFQPEFAKYSPVKPRTGKTMAEGDFGPKGNESKVHDLASTLKRVKSAQASRDDVVVDMKHAKISRLELLANDLAPVFGDIPKNNDQFEFAITNGEVPRLWIDMTSFVRMGRDAREYEFVKDTSFGRTILAHSFDREIIGQRVTEYVAERILERERAIEGDWSLVRGRDTRREKFSGSETHKDGPLSQHNGKGYSPAIWFVLGFLVSASIMMLFVALDGNGQMLEWIRGLGG